MEGASWSVVKYGDSKNVMTRDYFDFHITHFSTVSNTARQSQFQVLYAYMKPRLEQLIADLKSIAESRHDSCRRNDTSTSSCDFRMFNKTIAIIPFTVKSGSPLLIKSEYQVRLRSLYFQATFWSVYRYMPHVVVTVSTKRDMNYIARLKLPIWQIADLRNFFNESAVRKEPGSSIFLPKESLMFALSNLVPRRVLEMVNSTLIRPGRYRQYLRARVRAMGGVKAIYYTEADHMLHLRHDSDLMDVLEEDRTVLESQLVIPHRMHNFLLPSDASELVESKFFFKYRMEALKNINLEVEPLDEATGSCCDDGRFVFKSCKIGFWHHCKDWGLRNYTTWLRYGPNGVPFPTGSAHQAKCTYYPEKRVCDAPPTCTTRYPSRTKNESAAFYKYCSEIDKVVHVGPWEASP